MARACLCFPRSLFIARRAYSVSGTAREAFLEHGKGDDVGITYLTLDRPGARNALCALVRVRYSAHSDLCGSN
jgi:hypothetical protein